MYDISVFIGRFQPFHMGHLHNILIALKNSKKIVINIGSCFNPPNIKNPFSFEQRKKMIESDLKFIGINLDIVAIEPLADYFYQEQKWKYQLRKNIYKYSKYNDNIVIVGHIKDYSSYYIKSFPEWNHINVNNYKNFNASEFRNNFYNGIILKEYMCSTNSKLGTYNFLKRFMHTKIYQKLIIENKYINKYKKIFKDVNYKPVFIIVNVLIIINNYILIIKKKDHPGKDLWALPGGSLYYNETISQAMIRIIFKETNICLTKKQLNMAKYCEKVFDYPNRSLLGRVISHTGFFIFNKWKAKLPKISAANNLISVKWISLDSIINSIYDKMLEDHYQIITFLIEEYSEKYRSLL